MKDFEELVKEPFSKYAASLNHISEARWPVLVDTHPLRINLSHKSTLQPHVSSALLNIRARAIFGTGARADLVTFFLVCPNTDFSIAEVAAIGYSKRNLAEVLNDLYFGNLFSRSLQGNQQLYRLNKSSPLFQLLKPIPKLSPSWHLIFKVLLSLRACIQRTESYAESTKVVELCNYLKEHEKALQKLQLHPPIFQNNFSAYLEKFSQWILEWTSFLAKG